jgi:hypothetical protein
LEVNAELSTEDFLAELRSAIFNIRSSDCLAPLKIKALYEDRLGEVIETNLLSHIVSCPRCLDDVNRTLQLPLLSERHPVNTLGKDPGASGKSEGPKRGGGAGAGSGGDGGGEDILSAPRRRLKERLAHRPQQLRVSVNGFILGAQNVSSALEEQTISVQLDEQIGFVEIFSEQEVRLLFSIVEPPPAGPVEHRKRVKLSDGRTLELMLTFSSPRPDLQVIYTDPTFRAAGVQAPHPAEETVSSPVPEGAPEKTLSPAGSKPLRRLWAEGRKKVLDWRLWLRPSTVTAVFALALVGMLLLTSLVRVPAPGASAAELLRRSTVAESASAARSDQVLHRTLILEERKGVGGGLIARLKVEVWQSAERGVTARRLYNEGGRLIAGDWRSLSGVQTLYRHGARPELRRTDRRTDAALALNTVWQLDPSAKDFTALIGGSNLARVEERAGHYLISYESEDRAAQNGLVRATLLLKRDDLRAVEQTLLARRDGEMREYKLVETGFESLPVKQVSPTVFEPETELSRASAGGTERSPSAAKAETDAARTQPSSPATVSASAELEVEVLRLLSEAGADLGEQVSVLRTSEGRLRIEGIIETDKRKAEILRALGPLAGNPAVQIDVATVAERMSREARQGKREATGAQTMSSVATETDVFPAYADLRERFSDEAARQFASRVVNRSDRMMRRAGALKQLAGRFSPEAFAKLDAQAQAKLLALVRGHARALQTEIIALRRDLETAFPNSALVQVAPAGGITDPGELLRAIERLFELSAANDQTIRAAFSISNGPSTTAIRAPQFWRSLAIAESMAGKIAR